jgi:hypothetical protein
VHAENNYRLATWSDNHDLIIGDCAITFTVSIPADERLPFVMPRILTVPAATPQAVLAGTGHSRNYQKLGVKPPRPYAPRW